MTGWGAAGFADADRGTAGLLARRESVTAGVSSFATVLGFGARGKSTKAKATKASAATPKMDAVTHLDFPARRFPGRTAPSRGNGRLAAGFFSAAPGVAAAGFDALFTPLLYGIRRLIRPADRDVSVGIEANEQGLAALRTVHRASDDFVAANFQTG